MSGPLINKDEIASALWETSVGRPAPRALAAAADRVMAYLREVLTPEALKTYETFVASDGHLSSGVLSGTDLHRRIFGEDETAGAGVPKGSRVEAGNETSVQPDAIGPDTRRLTAPDFAATKSYVDSNRRIFGEDK